MGNLKKLVGQCNSGLSQKKGQLKDGYGLKDFLACSTNQMLMTRGGYGGYGGSEWDTGWPPGTQAYGGSLGNGISSGFDSFTSTVGSFFSGVGDGLSSWGPAISVAVNIGVGIVIGAFTGGTTITDIPIIPDTGVAPGQTSDPKIY